MHCAALNFYATNGFAATKSGNGSRKKEEAEAFFLTSNEVVLLADDACIAYSAMCVCVCQAIPPISCFTICCINHYSFNLLRDLLLFNLLLEGAVFSFGWLREKVIRRMKAENGNDDEDGWESEGIVRASKEGGWGGGQQGQKAIPRPICLDGRGNNPCEKKRHKFNKWLLAGD